MRMRSKCGAAVHRVPMLVLLLVGLCSCARLTTAPEASPPSATPQTAPPAATASAAARAPDDAASEEVPAPRPAASTHTPQGSAKGDGQQSARSSGEDSDIREGGTGTRAKGAPGSVEMPTAKDADKRYAVQGPKDNAEPKAQPAADDSQYEFCDEIAARVPQSDCAYVRAQAARVRAGEGAFNAPSSMLRGETTTIQLTVARLEAGKPGRAMDVVKDLPGTKTSMGEVLVGDHMVAELTGVGFEVEAMSRRDQALPPDSVVSWEWKVTARTAGTRVLTLKTMVTALTSDGNWHPLGSSIKSRTITVRVGFWDKAKDILTELPGWVKLLTSVVVALSALAAAALKLRAQLHPKRHPKVGTRRPKAT